MKEPPEIGIGVLGMGFVGTSVVQTLLQQGHRLAKQIGVPLNLNGVLVKDHSKARPITIPENLITTDPSQILNNPDIKIIVELIGGESPASSYIKQAISLGKHVVTANKEVMSKLGNEILQLAHKNKIHVLFEASVGGGIPLIGPLIHDLTANELFTIRGIINGTTNYILTKMGNEGLDFSTALAEAQKFGYAEADPSLDIEGLDAAYKLSILSTIGFHKYVKGSDVYSEGITKLKAKDFIYAKELGYAIKLIAVAHRENKSLQVRVHPAFIPENVIMAKVDGVFNAVEITGDMVGQVFFHGMGAGPLPTSSAIISNLVEIGKKIINNDVSDSLPRIDSKLEINPISNLETKYYIRLILADKPGVFAKVGLLLGKLDISISSVIQKEVIKGSGAAEVVIMTHRSKESAIQEALSQMKNLDIVKEIGNMVRVEEWVI